MQNYLTREILDTFWPWELMYCWIGDIFYWEELVLYGVMELEKKINGEKIIWISCVSNIILTSDEIL